ncbi:MAG: porin family protein [Cyclobacteriaceae bacterium]|jgi:hypothetical protein|nr:porin family protein [Cytophagales bacterium]MCZ8326863.1 porin family protein [Cyclobacteriaceae bacterium]
MKRLYIVIIFAIAFFSNSKKAVSQSSSSCAQTLRLAQSVYEQGRLQEIQTILKSCVEGSGMTVEERVAAYKLLCLTKIYLEEPEEADVYMLKILQTNHEFKANETADPAEFVALYKTFRTDPIYRLGGRLGTLVTQPNVVSSDIVNDGSSEYAFRLGYAIQFAAEIPLPGRLKRFTINPELAFQAKGFTHTNTLGNFESEGIEHQSWISLPVILQYRFYQNKDDNLRIYGGLGFAVDYLLAAEITASKIRGENASSLPEKALDIKKDRNSFNYSIVAAAGLKKKVGKGYLTGEIRFQYGLKEVTRVDGTFSNPTLTWEYGLVDSIYKLNSMQIQIGYLINIYNPKKLNR